MASSFHAWLQLPIDIQQERYQRGAKKLLIVSVFYESAWIGAPLWVSAFFTR
jgi:hypothetical protein